MIVPSDYILKAVMRNFRQTSHCMVPHYICASAWEDQRYRCVSICHMALPARASQCQYEN